jgi:hypothetical protein
MRSDINLAVVFSAVILGTIMLMSQPSNAAQGDGCTIDLKDGLKEPGTEQASGDCKGITGKLVKKGTDGTYKEQKVGGSSTNNRHPGGAGANPPSNIGTNKGPSGGGKVVTHPVGTSPPTKGASGTMEKSSGGKH